MVQESPSTALYTLGKGILYAAEWSGGSAGEYFDLGNAPEVRAELVTEMLDHYSSRSGIRNKDKQVLLERGYRVNFSLDEMAQKNLSLFVMGTIDGNTVHGLSDAGTSKEFALKFVSDNPEGPNRTWEFWRCKIKPNGESSLIGDEWMTLPYIAEGLSDTTNHASSPFFDVTEATTTTTAAPTTTTSAA